MLNRFPESGAALEKALELAPGHEYARANLDYLDRFWRRGDVVQIDFPPRPRVRHGHGPPAHTRLAALLAETDYRLAAQVLADLAPALSRWSRRFLLDADALKTGGASRVPTNHPAC